MSPSATMRPALRAVAVICLLVVLAGLFVLAGTGEPNPADNAFPGNDEVGPDPSAYVGERVAVSGTVVSHDPLQIETEYGVDGTHVLEVTGVAYPPPVGHPLRVFGTLTEHSTIHAENTVTREPWEAIYMYIISFVAGLWVLSRLLRHWRFDPDDYAVVPRGERHG